MEALPAQLLIEVYSTSFFIPESNKVEKSFAPSNTENMTPLFGGRHTLKFQFLESILSVGQFLQITNERHMFWANYIHLPVTQSNLLNFFELGSCLFMQIFCLKWVDRNLIHDSQFFVLGYDQETHTTYCPLTCNSDIITGGS